VRSKGAMDRRLFLSLVAGCAAWPSIAYSVSRPPIALRRLRLVNAHTGETFEGAYRNDKGPIERVIDELCIFLRDHHSGEKTRIDVGVVDFLADLLDAVGETKATILSAYRTAETNAMLARTTFGVAEHSQHIVGRALDIRLESKLSDAMTASWSRPFWNCDCRFRDRRAVMLETRFAPDSLLEGDVFELSVPLAKERRFRPLITRNSLTTTPSAFQIGGNSIRSQGIT
jgi:uncharacterized protein YcbK (DUF882 family)